MGLLCEIQQLLDSGIPPKCTAMQAIGYKEFVDHLNGLCSLAEATALVQQSSRHYAKRQLTWFRRNSAMHWLRRSTGDDSNKILMDALAVLTDFDN